MALHANDLIGLLGTASKEMIVFVCPVPATSTVAPRSSLSPSKADQAIPALDDFLQSIDSVSEHPVGDVNAVSHQSDHAAASSANQGIVDIFTELARITLQAESESAPEKSAAYGMAAKAFARVKYPITIENGPSLGPGGTKKLDGVGKASRDKMLEFLRTGHIAKLEVYREALLPRVPVMAAESQVKKGQPSSQVDLVAHKKPKQGTTQYKVPSEPEAGDPGTVCIFIQVGKEIIKRRFWSGTLCCTMILRALSTSTPCESPKHIGLVCVHAFAVVYGQMFALPSTSSLVAIMHQLASQYHLSLPAIFLRTPHLLICHLSIVLDRQHTLGCIPVPASPPHSKGSLGPQEGQTFPQPSTSRSLFPSTLVLCPS